MALRVVAPLSSRPATAARASATVSAASSPARPVATAAWARPSRSARVVVPVPARASRVARSSPAAAAPARPPAPTRLARRVMASSAASGLPSIACKATGEDARGVGVVAVVDQGAAERDRRGGHLERLLLRRIQRRVGPVGRALVVRAGLGQGEIAQERGTIGGRGGVEHEARRYRAASSWAPRWPARSAARRSAGVAQHSVSATAASTCEATSSGSASARDQGHGGALVQVGAAGRWEVVVDRAARDRMGEAQRRAGGEQGHAGQRVGQAGRRVGVDGGQLGGGAQRRLVAQHRDRGREGAGLRRQAGQPREHRGGHGVGGERGHGGRVGGPGRAQRRHELADVVGVAAGGLGAGAAELVAGTLAVQRQAHERRPRAG